MDIKVMINDIINHFYYGNYVRMVKLINDYPSGKYACFKGLKQAIFENNQDLDDFADIVIVYFLKVD